MSDQTLNVVPTRMELQNLKGKLQGAVRGHDLLKKKSDALAMKFRSLLREIRETKLRIGQLAQDAAFAYTEVKFIANDISPTVIQSVGTTAQMLTMSLDNIAGVRVPDFCRVNPTSDVNMFVGLSRGGQQIQKAREAYTELLDNLIRLAMLQTSFQIIDQVLKVTNRRVNAMEYVLIPRYKNTISIVDNSLEENEREEFYRLKKVQSKRKAQQELEEQERLARFAVKADDKQEVANALDDDSTDDSDVLF
ncbi:V-type ATPase, D subunit family protein [Tritrichomonas foetus]|uniref:V-type ATPase, D subunit family protein n=1 Tax=Tritrichomonas foetus TaxID=1144522 RepID=A0A1J4JM15_9EUKA|nr:V-type ATPase, D subunit family protein [Tritrichomonas foetus]|eukprot:OHT00161.1 V-type ATPase, D subunit family protein [Tritrichomonas foetus]